MAETPGALARWRAHLEEVIGVENAAQVVDPFASIDWTRLDQRIERIDRRVAHLEFRFDGLEARFDRFEERFDGLEVRYEGIEARFERLEDRFDRFGAEVRGDFKDLRRDLLRVTAAQFFALAAAVAALVGLA
jgi:chaperonin cofactor prefoldin